MVSVVRGVSSVGVVVLDLNEVCVDVMLLFKMTLVAFG